MFPSFEILTKCSFADFSKRRSWFCCSFVHSSLLINRTIPPPHGSVAKSCKRARTRAPQCTRRQWASRPSRVKCTSRVKAPGQSRRRFLLRYELAVSERLETLRKQKWESKNEDKTRKWGAMTANWPVWSFSKRLRQLVTHPTMPSMRQKHGPRS